MPGTATSATPSGAWADGQWARYSAYAADESDGSDWPEMTDLSGNGRTFIQRGTNPPGTTAYNVPPAGYPFPRTQEVSRHRYRPPSESALWDYTCIVHGPMKDLLDATVTVSEFQVIWGTTSGELVSFGHGTTGGGTRQMQMTGVGFFGPLIEDIPNAIDDDNAWIVYGFRRVVAAQEADTESTWRLSGVMSADGEVATKVWDYTWTETDSAATGSNALTRHGRWRGLTNEHNGVFGGGAFWDSGLSNEGYRGSMLAAAEELPDGAVELVANAITADGAELWTP